MSICASRLACRWQPQLQRSGSDVWRQASLSSNRLMASSPRSTCVVVRGLYSFSSSEASEKKERAESYEGRVPRKVYRFKGELHLLLLVQFGAACTCATWPCAFGAAGFNCRLLACHKPQLIS